MAQMPAEPSPHWLRQGLDLIPRRAGEADEAISHGFPTLWQAPRGWTWARHRPDRDRLEYASWLRLARLRAAGASLRL